MKLIIVRHGQSRWQVEGDAAGNDAPLSALGELQAHRLGEYLRTRETVGRIYASDLRRAQRTAALAAEYLKLPVLLDPDLREFDNWEAGWAPHPQGMWNPAPDAEFKRSYAEFRARIAVALQHIVAACAADGVTPLVVAHGGTIGVMLRLLIGSDTPRMWMWNTALNAVEWARPGWGDYWMLHYLNNQDHLPPFMRTS